MERVPDPMQSSRLNPKKADLEKRKIKPFFREITWEQTYKDGSRFMEIYENPHDQMLFARLMKGIVNVSDIVETEAAGEKRYASYIMPHEAIEDALSKPKIAADLLLMAYVFNETDRKYPYQNMAVSSRGGKTLATYFDFNNFTYFWYDNLIPDRESLTKMVKKLGAGKVNKVYLLGRLGAVRERFAGEEGQKFLVAVLSSIPERPHLFDKAAPAHTDDMELVRRMQDTILRRVNELEKRIDELNS